MLAPQWDLPSNLINNPFLLVRFVVFSLQIYLTLTALAFASWNAGASRAAGVHVDGASGFIIFNGITTSLSIILALMDIKISFFSTSMLGFECVWTGVFTILQIAASIFVSLTGPPEFCEAKASISVCASATILVPISWLAATLLLGYFVAISTLCIAHLRNHPALWFTSIYSITWFADDDNVVSAANRRSLAPQLPPFESSGPTRLSVISRRHSTSSFPRDVENQVSSGSPDIDKPLPSPAPSNANSANAWWGRLIPGRAGKDHPFRFRRTKAPEYKWWVKGEENNSNDNDDQEAGDKAPPEYPGSQPQTPGESRFVPYPSIPLNEDEPIPVDNRSEWVHAERALGS